MKLADGIYDRDGYLTQLGHAGKLETVAGVVVGDMEKCDWHEGRPEWPRTTSLEDVLEEKLEPLGVRSSTASPSATQSTWLRCPWEWWRRSTPMPGR